MMVGIFSAFNFFIVLGPHKYSLKSYQYHCHSSDGHAEE